MKRGGAFHRGGDVLGANPSFDLELPAPRPDQAWTHLPARVPRSDDHNCASAHIAGGIH